jgi:tRNA threonylcarbamoyladenosine biosynthesis protein TsaE
MSMIEIKTFSADETTDMGLKLGRALKKGDVVCLDGDLGVGKTAFTKGIAKGLGIKGYVTSPTFTIVNEYTAVIPLYHFDVYRIADCEEMFEIGFEEYIEGDGIVVIEWANSIKDILPENRIQINIKKDKKDQDARIIFMDFMGEKYEDRQGVIFKKGTRL